jgi:hypothetical protein
MLKPQEKVIAKPGKLLDTFIYRSWEILHPWSFFENFRLKFSALSIWIINIAHMFEYGIYTNMIL